MLQIACKEDYMGSYKIEHTNIEYAATNAISAWAIFEIFIKVDIAQIIMRIARHTVLKESARWMQVEETLWKV